jgi:hypothetical protein
MTDVSINDDYKTCYQPSPVGMQMIELAHAVSKVNPSRSIASEELHEPIEDDEWPGRGPACDDCRNALLDNEVVWDGD